MVIPIRSLLKSVYSFAKSRNIKLFIVGGALRDIFLGREKDRPDIDFVLKKGAIEFGRQIARKLKAGFVILDEERAISRTVKKIKEKTYTFDFTNFRGQDLKDDLSRRDFTINAMALELNSETLGIWHKLNKQTAQEKYARFFIDPYGARSDLKNKIVRLVSADAFKDDPLRILRVFSFAAITGFDINKDVFKEIKKERQGLFLVSPERVRDELFKIFSTGSTNEQFKIMDECRIPDIIFPETKKMRGIGKGPYHNLDVWQHTLETVKELDNLIKEKRGNKNIREYLEEVISGERKRRQLIMLAAFLHDVGKPSTLRYEDGKVTFHGHERLGFKMTEDISQRLKLSGAEVNSLKRIVLWHLRPGYLADNEIITPRAIFRFFRDTAEEAVSILLLSVADQRATKGPFSSKKGRLHHEKVAFSLIRRYFIKKKEKKHPRLVDGNDIMREFKIPPSPLVGKILLEIEELRAAGKVKSKKDAFIVAASQIKLTKGVFLL